MPGVIQRTPIFKNPIEPIHFSNVGSVNTSQHVTQALLNSQNGIESVVKIAEGKNTHP